MKFGSVCSGIEAASLAFGPLGWEAAWLSEIEPFPSAVLAHHHPHVPNLGDMTTIADQVQSGAVDAPDVLCGGTPCQAFSVAGLRQSLADARGNLTLKFVELANAIDNVRVRTGKPAAIVFWENVPGVLNTPDNAFGCFLAGLAGEDEPLQPPGARWTNAGCVYGPTRAVAWRVLDAQYFGVAQRRRRVFVVASARNGFDPAEVLFEWNGLRRDTAPRREAGQVAPTIPARSSAGGGLGTDFDCDGGLIAHTLRGEGFDASEDGTGRGTPLVPVIPFDTTQITSAANRSNPQAGDPCHPLAAGAHAPAIAFPARLSGTQCASAENLSPPLGALNPTAVAIRTAQTGSNGWGINTEGTAYTLDSAQQAVAYSTKLHNTQSNQAGKIYEEYTAGLDRNSPPPALLAAMQVRRLTARECERLQGFQWLCSPDYPGAWQDEAGRWWSPDYTAIPWRKKPASECPDGPRYKALGNSWAVPCVAWIGRRIAAAVALRAAA